MLQIYSARHPSVTFRTKIVDSAVSAMALTSTPSLTPSPTPTSRPTPNPHQVSAMAALQRRRDFHMVILDVEPLPLAPNRYP